MINLEEEKIKALIKKVRKWCVIATVIVIVAMIIYTGVKLYLVTNAASSGMNAISRSNEVSDPEGAGKVFNGFLGLFVAAFSGIAIVGIIIIGIIKIIAVVGLIWIGFLIFYLVQRSKLKKLETKPAEATVPVQKNQENS